MTTQLYISIAHAINDGCNLEYIVPIFSEEGHSELLIIWTWFNAYHDLNTIDQFKNLTVLDLEELLRRGISYKALQAYVLESDDLETIWAYCTGHAS